MSKLDICLVVAVILLSVGLLVTTSAKTIKVYNDKSLKEHLCAGSVAPNTNLIITETISLTDEVFCLVENTSNISITAEVQDYQSHITVSCYGCGFGFFNVSNLTIRSVKFDGFGAIVPPRAVKVYKWHRSVPVLQQYKVYTDFQPLHQLNTLQCFSPSSGC